ncbi:MAG: DUF6475 domain-containing protein [Dehalococcoidia bacterium]|jgi:hypothetical protein
MKDRLAFIQAISGLAEVFNAEMSEMKLAIYEEALSRFSDEQVQAAINYSAGTMRFFPKPVELIEAIEGSKEEQATLAWESLLNAITHEGAYHTVDFEDGRISKTVRMLGGWQEICMTPTKKLQWLCKDFIAVYKALPPDTERELMIGIHEFENSKRGFLDHIPKPVQIPCLSKRVGAAMMISDAGECKALPKRNENQPELELAR